MKLQLDEDIASTLLADRLIKAGHTVATPMSAGTLGRSDAVQMAHAIREDLVFVSRNYEDFEELHLLILLAGGKHPGILIVRRENDPSRDMTPKGIVAAIRNVENSGVPLQNEYFVLNQWR